MPHAVLILALLFSTPPAALHTPTVTLPDLSTVPPDLTVPDVSAGPPAPGRRVSQTTPGWEPTQVHHLLYLPTDWTPETKFPVLVEYAGNGNYKNKFGDVSDGSVEGSRLGYGISGGRGFIWLCLPFVEVNVCVKSNAVTWWGDVAETKRYCIATVKDVCDRCGGDADRVILCGFSRGSIACNFIGLHDDEIAKLWRAFICHSHFDGMIVKWPYAGADRASALERLQRLDGRPQFISHEGGEAWRCGAQEWLCGTGIAGNWTLAPIPFRNHSDAWVLRDLPQRRQLREWLAGVVQKQVLQKQQETGQ